MESINQAPLRPSGDKLLPAITRYLILTSLIWLQFLAIIENKREFCQMQEKTLKQCPTKASFFSNVKNNTVVIIIPFSETFSENNVQ